MNNTTNYSKQTAIKHLASYFAKPLEDSHIYAPLCNELVDRYEKDFGKAETSKIINAAAKLAGK